LIEMCSRTLEGVRLFCYKWGCVIACFVFWVSYYW